MGIVFLAERGRRETGGHERKLKDKEKKLVLVSRAQIHVKSLWE